MRSSHSRDRLDTAFDDRLVAAAGSSCRPPSAVISGLQGLVDEHLDLGAAPGRANVGDTLLTLIMSAFAGGDSANSMSRWSCVTPSRWSRVRLTFAADLWALGAVPAWERLRQVRPRLASGATLLELEGATRGTRVTQLSPAERATLRPFVRLGRDAS